MKPERIKWIMLISGSLTAFLFIISLLAIKIFPPSFKWLALAMVISAIVFFVFRTLNGYNETYELKKKTKEKDSV